MNRNLLCAALVTAMLLGADPSGAATFSYHGTLQDGGKPAEGNYDIELTLYSAPSGGSVIGGPLIMHDVPVHKGSFNTQADFGPLANSFSQAYVATSVRAQGQSEFVNLNTRAEISASPETSSCPGAWTLQGNAGNPTGSYLGTADTQPLVFEVNGTQVGNITSLDADLPMVVFGASSNAALGDAATISGGQSNSIVAGFATIAGGQSNTVSLGGWAAVGGGQGNQANGGHSTVIGGGDNKATGNHATVTGGGLNTAGGDYSLAAGYGAVVRDATSAGNSGTCTTNQNCGDYGTFVWNAATGQSANGNATYTSSGPGQFLINAPGGVAINGTPKLPGHEMTIYGNGSDGRNDVDIDLFPQTATLGFALSAGGGSGQNPTFSILQTDGTSVFVNFLALDASGNLTIKGGTATKPGGGSWTATSDRRIKQDITTIHDALDTVLKLRPVNFHYTPEYRAMEGGLADKGYQGFIAQEFAEVFPEAVTSTDKQVPGAAVGDAPILALDPNPALITTVAAVQELAVRDQTNGDDIATLKQENAALRESLEQQNAALNAVLVRLNKLESQRAN